MWDLVGNPEDRFSQNEAQLLSAGKKTRDGKEIDTNDKQHGETQHNYFLGMVSYILPDSLNRVYGANLALTFSILCGVSYTMIGRHLSIFVAVDIQ